MPRNPQRWSQQIGFSLFIGGIFLAYEVYRNFGFFLAANTFWVTGTSVLYFKYPKYYFGIFGDLAQAMFTTYVGEALLWVFGCACLGLYLVKSKKRLGAVLDSFEYLFWAQILYMIFRRIFDQEFHRYLGAMDNEAMDATLLLVMYCMTLIRNKRPLYQHILFGGFMFLSGSTTAIAGLGGVWALWFMLEFSGTTKFDKGLKVLGALVIIGCVIGLGIGVLGSSIFWQSSGRTWVWQKSFEYWRVGANYFLGTGSGTYAIYGPGIQIQGLDPQHVNTVFIWMHNEYLQVLFELGVTGLILFLGLHLNGLYLSYKSKLNWLILTVVSFSFIEITQMPFRHAPTSLLAVVICCLVFGGMIDRSGMVEAQ